MDFTKLKACMDEILEETYTAGVDCMGYQNHTPVFRYFAGLRDAVIHVFSTLSQTG